MSTSVPGTHDETSRGLALLSTLVVLGVVLAVFYDLTATFGGTPWLVVYVALSFGAATVAARRAPTRLGVLAAAAVLGLGLLGYVVLLPAQYYGLFTVDAFLDDMTEWLTGQSVKLMLEADLWAVSVAPAPVFLTWYMAMRGRYDGAALAGGTALGFFVLTGNLGETATLVGMAGLLAIVGFGAVATSQGSWRQLQEVGLVVGLVVLFTRLVQVVPASGAAGSPDEPSGPPLERTLLDNRDSTSIGGSPSLSPKLRFTVDAEQKAYWHTRSFDRYDGQGWSRTDRALGAERPLDPPPSSGTTLQQSVTVESPTSAMPAAWKPVLLNTDTRRLGTVTNAGNIEPGRTLEPGTTYAVLSTVPSWTEEELASATGTYDDAMLERYTQLPDDLPDRLVEKTGDIVGDAASPYEAALAIQGWLEANKRYSLDVERRDWDIADAFTFALDAGYCVYFATTMAVMLRTQDVPARFVVGYAPGEDAGDGRWRLRGFHSHAWVEVYFDDVGWVTFDPTPAAPRQDAQQQELERRRSEGGDTSTPTPTPSPTPTATPTEPILNDSDGADRGTATPRGDEELAAGDDVPDVGQGSTPTGGSDLAGAVRSSRSQGSATPTRSSATSRDRARNDRLWMVGALATLAFGSIRLGYAQSALRSVWVRYQRRTDDPDHDVERALGRLEYHLESAFRPRTDGETRHTYLAALQERDGATPDPRAWRVVDISHRSRYGDGATEADADEAVEIVDDIVR